MMVIAWTVPKFNISVWLLCKYMYTGKGALSHHACLTGGHSFGSLQDVQCKIATDNVLTSYIHLASFPDSTPQLFIESGNKAIYI